MRGMKSRLEDATFALNLAPMLDIIVSVIPMLLMSIVFVKINVIESPLPQAVQEALQKQQDTPDEVKIELKVARDQGFEFIVKDRGQVHKSNVALSSGKLDLEGLKREAVSVKLKYPQIFRLDLVPDERVSLDDIVSIMDKVRSVSKTEARFAFNDTKTGKPVQTDLLFPSVIFANVMGD